MKLKKISYLIAIAVVLSSLAFFNLAKAENDNNNNNDDRKHFKEAHDNGSTLEVHIFDDSKVLVRGAKVTGVSGNVVSAYTAWGSVTLNWAVNSDSGKIIRKFGGTGSISEISVGDFISFHGKMVTTAASPLTVNADIIKDWSIQKKEANFNGTVKSVDGADMKFVLTTEERGEVTVMVTSSTKINKGDMTGTFTDITIGAKVSARGVLNTLTNQFTAMSVKIQSPKPVRTVMGGIIKSITATTVPTTLVVTSEGKDYTVNIASDTSILNNSWLKVGLSTFKIGDKIQVYGTVNANMTVDATVVRNIGILR